MIILGIETSCDDTGVALVRDGEEVLADAVASQVTHEDFGGVVPEIASREHLQAIYPLINQVMSEAGTQPDDLDRIAATQGPGLVGSLLVGFTAGQTLSFLWDVPFQPINHLIAHLYSIYLGGHEIELPVLALLASGGHTQLILINDYSDIELLGETRDDAAGEAFDKIAKMLDLPYPGGPEISRLAEKGEGTKKFLPRPMTDSDTYDFSFSGLKTAVSRALDKYERAEIAREAQAAITDSLVAKLNRAAREFKPEQVLLVGGVAANQRLRDEVGRELSDFDIFYPEQKYCTDNGAMVASAAHFLPFEKQNQWYNSDVNSTIQI